MKWIDDDAVASARFEPETKIAGKIRERMMNCGGERRGPRSLRTLPKDRQRGSWHAGFLYESKHAPRPRSALVTRVTARGKSSSCLTTVWESSRPSPGSNQRGRTWPGPWDVRVRIGIRC